MQEYPKWKYKGADAVLVHSKPEEDALEGHGDVPGYEPPVVPEKHAHKAKKD